MEPLGHLCVMGRTLFPKGVHYRRVSLYRYTGYVAIPYMVTSIANIRSTCVLDDTPSAIT